MRITEAQNIQLLELPVNLFILPDMITGAQIVDRPYNFI